MDKALSTLERNAINDPSLWRRVATKKKRIGDMPGFLLANARTSTFERGDIKVVAVAVDWMDRYANSPRIKVLLNREPGRDEFIYQTNKEQPSLHYAEVGPVCRFFSYSKPGRGYGGAKFTILMRNGSFKDLIGPWSSGSYAMNTHGFGPCMDVSYTADTRVWAKGHTYCGGSVRVDSVIPLLEEKGLGLCLMEANTYQPTSRSKYPTHGPYYNKTVQSVGSFDRVKKEILVPK